MPVDGEVVRLFVGLLVAILLVVGLRRLVEQELTGDRHVLTPRERRRRRRVSLRRLPSREPVKPTSLPQGREARGRGHA